MARCFDNACTNGNKILGLNETFSTVQLRNHAGSWIVTTKHLVQRKQHHLYHCYRCSWCSHTQQTRGNINNASIVSIRWGLEQFMICASTLCIHEQLMEVAAAMIFTTTLVRRKTRGGKKDPTSDLYNLRSPRKRSGFWQEYETMLIRILT